MTENGKEASKSSKNGCRRMINGSLYLPIKQRNENDTRNGEWQEGKEQPRMANTTTKEKRMDVKTLLEAEGRSNKWQDASITGEKE